MTGQIYLVQWIIDSHDPDLLEPVFV